MKIPHIIRILLLVYGIASFSTTQAMNDQKIREAPFFSAFSLINCIQYDPAESNYETLKKYIEENPYLITMPQSPYGRTLLHEAVAQHSSKIVQLLLEKSANINTKKNCVHYTTRKLISPFDEALDLYHNACKKKLKTFTPLKEIICLLANKLSKKTITDIMVQKKYTEDVEKQDLLLDFINSNDFKVTLTVNDIDPLYSPAIKAILSTLKILEKKLPTKIPKPLKYIIILNYIHQTEITNEVKYMKLLKLKRTDLPEKERLLTKEDFL